MATVTGSVNGQDVSVSNSSASVTSLAQSILAQTGVTAATGNTTLQSQFFATTAADTTVTGGAAVTVGVLTGANGVFVTGASQASEVVAGDFTNSSIINNNPNGSIIAFTGAGGNALVGSGVVNAFQTGIGGTDAVILGNASTPNQTNVLTSQGQDTVSIVGNGGAQTNFVSAVGNGSDNLTLGNGAALTFVNNSAVTSTIAGSAGSNVNLVGTGNTSVVAGSGAESFAVSTSSGNVTLVGSTSGGTDTFNFVRLAANNSASVDLVANFTSADSINLAGYGGNYNATVVNGSTVLTLGDGSKVIFAGISDSSAVTSRITGNA